MRSLVKSVCLSSSLNSSSSRLSSVLLFALFCRLSAKLHRVHGALDEQHRLLQVIRNNLNSRGFGQLVPLLNPLVNSIETCDATYKKWQEKQQQGPKRMTNVPPTARPPTANNNATVVEPESKRIKV